MKPVCKYNVFKGVSTVLTVGTPIVTLCSCSELFVHRSETAISAAGVFAILLTILFAKDKILENFKLPSAFVVSMVGLIALMLIESIIVPLKYVFVATMCASGVDELTFKRFYKSIEAELPDCVQTKKFAGLIFGFSDNLLGKENE